MEGGKPFDPARMKRLEEQVEGFLKWTWRLHRQNGWWSTGVIVVGLLLGTAVSAAGFLGYGVMSGVLGLLVTLFVGLQNAFNFAEKSSFYWRVHIQGKALRDRLFYRVKTEDELLEAVEALAVLRTIAVGNAPKGKGIDAVREAPPGPPLPPAGPGPV